MQAAVVNEAHNTQDGEKEVDVLRSLQISEYLAIDNAGVQVLRGGDVLRFQEQDVSKIEESH